MSFLKDILKGTASYLELQSQSVSSSKNFTEEQRQDMQTFSGKMRDFKEWLDTEKEYGDEEEELFDASWFWTDVNALYSDDGSVKARVKKEFVRRYIQHMSDFKHRFASVDVNQIIDGEHEYIKFFIRNAVEDSWKVIARSGVTLIEKNEYMYSFNRCIDAVGSNFYYMVAEEIRINEDWEYGEKGRCYMRYMDEFCDYLNNAVKDFLQVIDGIFS